MAYLDPWDPAYDQYRDYRDELTDPPGAAAPSGRTRTRATGTNNPDRPTFPPNPNNPDGPVSPGGEPLPPDTPGVPPTTPPAGTPPAGTPPAGTPPPDPWATAPTDGNWERWFRTNLGRDTLTPAELIALEGALNRVGVQVMRNAAGVAGKIRLPSGQIVDVIQAAGAGGNRFQWLVGDGDGASDPNAGIPTDPINPDYLTPFTEVQPTREALPGYTATPFNAPTADDILGREGYRFRLGEGLQALENSAAARGTLNSGGTLKDLVNYGQRAGSQEYDAEWDRAFNLWGTGEANRMSAYQTTQDALDRAYDDAYNAWVGRRDTHYSNQTNPYLKLAGAGQQR